MSETTSPKASVGLPVFNGGQYLEHAIESLLAQTFTDFELIISDNASTDSTSEICGKYVEYDGRVRYHRNDVNIGAARNFNKVVSLARGTFFAWANHDDFWGQAYLERCIEALEADSASVLSYSGSYLVDELGAILAEPLADLRLDAVTPWERLRKYHDLLLEVERDPEYCPQIAEGLWIPVYGLMRMEALCKTKMIGKYISSDTVLIEEMLAHGTFTEVPEKLFYKRDHAERSMQACFSFDKRIAWFTGKKRPALMFPQWRLLLERFAAIWRAANGAQSKLLCCAELIRFARHRPGLPLWREISMKVEKTLEFARRGGRRAFRG